MNRIIQTEIDAILDNIYIYPTAVRQFISLERQGSTTIKAVAADVDSTTP
jgi:hypothetical protein